MEGTTNVRKLAAETEGVSTITPIIGVVSVLHLFKFFSPATILLKEACILQKLCLR
eukprot:CAMPEP_0114288352 /NCGR_PEP_ID=MMETSP0059-20121206/6760_1 /TAXON_ID=36894 /ORGANISM="Pyramimonas parkeae, Strain CCMP726" /LENGTH=55 /DNA_ID=CAMNT_0001409483 /DNA_START=778 /DNA_END=945 /DNA_ORIENTATION=+